MITGPGWVTITGGGAATTTGAGDTIVGEYPTPMLALDTASRSAGEAPMAFSSMMSLVVATIAPWLLTMLMMTLS